MFNDAILESRFIDLGDACELAAAPDNAFLTPYNHGMANGLRLALAIITGSEPKYINMREHYSDRATYTFNEYQRDAAKTAIYPEKVALLYLGLKLSGEAGEVGELIAKAYRDDEGFITAARKEKLLKELGDVLWYVSELARRLGFMFSEVAEANRIKLTDRAERGVIKGEGSDR